MLGGGNWCWEVERGEGGLWWWKSGVWVGAGRCWEVRAGFRDPGKFERASEEPKIDKKTNKISITHVRKIVRVFWGS